MDTKQMLLEFSALTGVSGMETEAARYGAKLLEAYGKVRVSPLGSVICTVRKPEQNGVHIMLDAHMDEIGMAVSYIEEKGFLRVGETRSMDERGLLASPVTVHTENGPVAGVICSIPPHLNKDKDGAKNKKAEEIYIDIGASGKAEAEKLVSPGDRVTMKSRARELLNGLVSCKALDDRAGCAALVKALDYLGLDGNPLNCGLSVVFSSMEEVGGQGAKTAAYEVNPTHAVAVDVSFAHTPQSKKEKCGELRKGPMVGFAPILSADISKRLCALAEENKIPFQHEVMSGRTGTNADAIATARAGVRTALVSIPLRYMHTPIETVSVEDVENTAKLIAAFIRDLDKEAAR